MDTKKKKTTKRSKVKNASLKKRYNSRVRQENIDMDYLDQLNDIDKNVKLPNGKMVTELEYMAIFMSEYNNASVPKQSEPRKGKIHRTKALIKDCTDRNNWRNNDLISAVRAENKMVKGDYSSLIDLLDEEHTPSQNEQEDILIDLIDNLHNSGGDTEDES